MFECGTTNSQNNTYLTKTTYTTGTDLDPCTYTICASQADVTKIRIDFNTFDINGPTEILSGGMVASGTAATSTTSVNGEIDFQAGHCMKDTLHIVSPGHASPPIVCGHMTGQHMFIKMSEQCVKIQINIDTDTTFTRTWDMKITQFEAGSQMAPQADCLQYFTELSGNFASFNWDMTDTATTVAKYSQWHLANQNYNVCFRRSKKYCSICYSPHVTVVAPATYPANTGASYGLGSFTAAGTVLAAASDNTANHCGGFTIADGITNAASNVAQGDYLEIERAQSGTPSATAQGGTYRLCGNVFNTALTGTAHTTVCSYATPFKVGVHFDEAESFDFTTTGINNVIENTDYPTGADGPGHGYSGFWLDYFQVAC